MGKITKTIIGAGVGAGVGVGVSVSLMYALDSMGVLDDVIGMGNVWKNHTPKTLKFPLEGESAGNFWTMITFNSWVPVESPADKVKSQNNFIAKDFIGKVMLPMPLTLGTQYNQSFSDAEGMMNNRGESGTGIASSIDKSSKGVGMEIASMVEAVISPNNSSKMSKGSILNNKMGMIYEGPTLRGHTFSWRMTPRNTEEQAAIESIVNWFKIASSPKTASAFGNVDDGEVAKQIEEMNKLREADAQLPMPAVGDAEKWLKNYVGIGRLSIPPTISIQFWDGDKINRHLFEVKDSFITNVDVNYTPAGNWTAYDNGAPIETQLTITCKEISVLTFDDMKKGY